MDQLIYFVHEHYLIPDNNKYVSSIAKYSIDINSSVEKKLNGVQFHPEKKSI